MERGISVSEADALDAAKRSAWSPPERNSPHVTTDLPQAEAEKLTPEEAKGEAERWAQYPEKLAAHHTSVSKFVEEIDRLRAENLQLKVLQINTQLEALQQRRHALLVEMENLQGILEAKYHIDLRTHQIRSEDGVIVPINGSGR